MDALRLALLGRKLGHSKSPIIHRFLGEALGVELEYSLVETDAPMSIFGMGLDGFNVTVPYKESLFAGLSRVDPLAARVGAVNTVRRTGTGWEGFNTDYAGFRAMLARAGIGVEGADFLVLGSGGAAKGCALALADGGARSIRVASRKGGGAMPLVDAGGRETGIPLIGYGEAEGLGGLVLVNATPVGMSPDEGTPVPAETARRMTAVADVVFNPFYTPLLRAAASAGIPCADGLDMLAIQGARAFELWMGKTVGLDLEDALCRILRLRAASGFAVVGMPFSGQSTVTARLRAEAEAAGVRVVDLDAAIEAEAGASIPEIFGREGEAGFRARETRALEAAVAGGPHLIACGGGVLTREENLRALRNDAVAWLDVGRDELVSRYRASDPGSRPLIKSAEDLAAAYERRLPVYRAAARIRGNAEEIEAAGREWLGTLRSAGGGS